MLDARHKMLNDSPSYFSHLTSYYSIDQAWVISFLSVTIFMLALIKVPFEIQRESSPLSRSSLVFEIEGKINYPGFYFFNGSITVGNAVKRAGGLIENITVPSCRFFSQRVINGNRIKLIDGNRVDFMEAEKFILFFIPFDLNQATAVQLNAIPGIGEKLSRSIFEYRAQHGCFNSIEELKNVPGVGNSNFNTMKNYFYLSFNGGSNGS
jgi:competence protein ComEA